MSGKSGKPRAKGTGKSKEGKTATDDEPPIIDEDTTGIADANPGLEEDTSSGKVSGLQPGAASTEGWLEFDPRCSECKRTIVGSRADKCPECGVIMHPYCYHQHFMRNHLPKAIPLTINVSGTLLPDGTYGDYKGFIKND